MIIIKKKFRSLFLCVMCAGLILLILLQFFWIRENFETTDTSTSTSTTTTTTAADTTSSSSTTTANTTTSTSTSKSSKSSKNSKASSKPTTITCGRGKNIKKVTGINPKCPTGFTAKKSST